MSEEGVLAHEAPEASLETAFRPAAPEPDAVHAAEATVAAEWNEGDVILDLYEVTGLLGEGGMGKVYKVHHRGWNVDLAVKSPRPEIFAAAGGQENFVREAETWVNLGLHPHIVSCYYVRTLGGIPRVLAEYVEGGSLSEWIRSGKLYEGGPEKTLERILDIAIQFAWGLHYAHEQGLVHQDVKPANVMLTADATAKVTDFGLAKARGVAGERAEVIPGASVLVSVGGMTPAYCSPEQAAKQALSRKTDIWSWAVSVLEMFTGEVTWLAGQAARLVLEEYLQGEETERSVPKLPAQLAELLRHCFEENPEARPRDFGVVVATLREIYEQQTGQAHARVEPRAAELLADGLNNQAVSLLDLGRREEAEKLFERALKADPHHLEATYNRGLLLWRSGRMTDDVVVRQLEEIGKTHEDDWRDEYYLGLVHMERGDGESAARVLEQASRQAPQEEEIQRALHVVRRSQGEWRSSVRTFEGHTDKVTSVSISPDGRWGLSGSWDRTLRLWELATGKCVRTFEGHTARVWSVSISPDGRWALSGSDDQTLRLWEPSTGTCMRIFRGNENWVTSVGISPDGRWALSGSQDKNLRRWELATGQCVRTFKGHTEAVHSVRISPDGRWGLSGSFDKTLRLWDMATGQCVRTFEGHTEWVTSVSISPDARRALSGSWDKTVRLWDLATGQCVRTLEGHTGSVRSVSISADGRWGLSGSNDKTLRLWELATGQCVRTFKGHTEAVHSVSISPDGRWGLSGSYDKTLRLWELKRTGPLASLTVVRPRSSAEVMRADTEVRRALESAKSALKQGDASRAAAEVSRARRVPGFERHGEVLELWRQVGLRGKPKSFSGGWLRRIFEGHTGMVKSVSISPDGRWVLSGGGDKTLRLWELERGTCVRTFEGHTDWVKSVSISPDGRWVLSGAGDKTLRLWELERGKCVRTFEGHTDEVESVSISPDGRWALSGTGGRLGSNDYTLRLWELATGKCVRTFEGHTKRVYSVSISPDGRWGLSGGYDETLRLWELATGQCVRTFEGHAGYVKSVSISPDGRWALSGSNDKTLWLWELATGKCVRTFEGHTARVCSVSISPDGRWALSASEDNTLRLWELATGKCVRTFEGHTNAVVSVSISPDGCWALSGSDDQTLRLWELDWEYEFPPPTDWDEGARPYLETFLTLRTPLAGELPKDRQPSAEEVTLALTRRGKPSWSEEDFNGLLHTLACAGYGWLRPEGVRRELEKLAASWTGPASLPALLPPAVPKAEEQVRPELGGAASTKATVGRNEPCPCGSGKKYKKCCGA
jgi:WD40 repeat protein/serine/threonine protein kinase